MTPRLDRLSTRTRGLLAVVLFGAAYYALSELGLELLAEPAKVAVLWPASGLALAVVVLSPVRWWPFLIGAVFVSNLTAQILSRGLEPVSFALATVNALEPLVAATVLLAVTGRARRFVYGSTRGVVGLLAAAVVGNGMTAFLGGGAVHLAFGAPLGPAVSQWWIGDGLGMLAVAPLIFAWGDRRRVEIKPEGVALVGVTGLTCWAILFPDVWGAPDFFARASVLLPVLVWTAIRAEPRIASLATLVVAIGLTLGTLAGRGPFVAPELLTPLESVANLQYFLAVAAVLPLMVEGVLSERRAVVGHLAASTANLESILSAATEVSIIGTDPEGVIDVFNAGAERMLGYDADDILGQTPATFHDPDEVLARARELGIDPGFEVFVHAAREGRPETRQWTYRRADGTSLQVSLTVTARVSKEGRLIGFMGIAQDVTESVRIEAERAALLRSSRAVAAADPLETTLGLVASEVGALNDADVAAVTRFDSPELGMVVGGWAADGGLDAGQPVNLSGDTAAAHVSRTGEDSRLGADQASPDPSGNDRSEVARVGVPVRVGGRLWGSISIGAKPGAGTSGDAVAGLHRFADLVGLAIAGNDSREEVKRKRDELSAIIDGLPALVWVQDLAGELLVSNRAFNVLAEEQMNVSRGELRAALADPAEDADALGADETISVEQEFTDGGGRVRTMLVARSRLVDAAGSVYALSCVATDITERRETERAKDQFIGVVSHELRTPLSSIRGALSLLSENEADLDETGRRRMVEIASSNSERLVALINDILDIQRIESGASVLEPVACEVADLVAQAGESMAPLAAEREITLETEPEPATAFAEPGRVLQVLSNFISNAVKFSEPGSRVTIGSTLLDGEAALFVRDRGRGIPADMVERVFDRFQQVDSSDSREVGGTGLGLAICREIAQQHGGRVWAESEEGVGSCFWLSLPLAPEPEEIAPIEADGGSILICDDDPGARAEARGLVEALGFTAIEAASGEVATTLARTEGPKAILLDLLMPGIDGYETLTLLSQDESTAAIPVVMLSALPPDRAEGAPAPVADWVTKPATAERLISALSRAQQSTESGRVLVVEDDPGLADVLLEQLRRDKIPAIHARTGRQAIEMATRLQPELIVLDVGLPDGDGFTVVETLRERNLVPKGMIVYSALEFDAQDRARLRLGNTDFVTKSRVSPHDFHRRLARLLPEMTRAEEPPAA